MTKEQKHQYTIGIITGLSFAVAMLVSDTIILSLIFSIVIFIIVAKDLNPK